MSAWLVTIDWGIWFSIIIRFIAFMFYAEHFWRVMRQWLDERTPRLFRSFVIAAVVAIGTFAILLSGLRQLWPQVEWLTRAFGAGAAGAILVGGIFVFVSHRMQGDAR